MSLHIGTRYRWLKGQHGCQLVVYDDTHGRVQRWLPFRVTRSQGKIYLTDRAVGEQGGNMFGHYPTIRQAKQVAEMLHRMEGI